MEPVNGQLLLDRQAQALYLQRSLVQAEAIEQARYFAALRHLAEDAHFHTVVLHWFQSAFLLTVQKTPEEIGEARFILRVLKDLREAPVHERVAVLKSEG